jgi:hypothetical protein
MTPTPTPLVSAPGSVAGPWDLTLPLVITIAAAILTAAGVIVVVLQRRSADARVQLWNRMEWALGLAASSDEDARAIGMNAIESLLDSDERRRGYRPPAKLTGYDRRLLRQAATVVYSSKGRV